MLPCLSCLRCKANVCLAKETHVSCNKCETVHDLSTGTDISEMIDQMYSSMSTCYKKCISEIGNKLTIIYTFVDVHFRKEVDEDDEDDDNGLMQTFGWLLPALSSLPVLADNEKFKSLMDFDVIKTKAEETIVKQVKNFFLNTGN